MKEIAIQVKDLRVGYKMMKKMSFFRSISPGHRQKPKVFEALKGVSFDVEEGEIVGIVGKNGSGKSTLLRTVGRIFAPDSGSVDLFGNSVSLLALGVGFQNDLSGRENIFLSGMLLGFNEAEIRAHLDAIIEFSELENFIDMPVKTYSSGMFSKLAFAITAVLETDIILVDEVLSVGDARFKKKSFKKMKEIIQNDNKTVLIVSHNSNSIRELCTRVIWLHDGEIRMIGETNEVVDAYNEFMENGK